MFLNIKSINFVLINRLILLTIFVVLLVFCYDLYFTNFQSKVSIHTLSFMQSNYYSKERKTASLSYYEKEISKRNIFKTNFTEPRINRVMSTGPTFKELIKDLQLLGIISGTKQQVIIEDIKLGKIYFLSLGDYLGEIKIEEICSDKVILEFKGEKIILFL